jgi:hypothetical protein
MNLFLIPVFLLFFVSIYKIFFEKGSHKSFILLIFSSLLLLFSSLQFPLLIIGAFPFLFLITFIFFKKELKKFFLIIGNRKRYVIVSLIFIITIFYLFHGRKFLGLFNGRIQFPSDKIYSVPIINFFIPNKYLATFSSAIIHGYRARIRNHGHSCFLCEIVIRSQFHTTYEPEA